MFLSSVLKVFVLQQTFKLVQLSSTAAKLKAKVRISIVFCI